MSKAEYNLEIEIDLDDTGGDHATIVSDAIASRGPDIDTAEIRRADIKLAEQNPQVRPLPVSALAPVPMLFVFESGSTQVQDALSAIGIAAKTVGLGGDLMSAVQAGEVSGVLFSPHMDEEMRLFLVRALKGRFPKVPLFVTTETGLNQDDKAEFVRAGVRAVFPWPLPPASELLPALDALLLEKAPRDPLPARGSEPALSELERLRQKVAQLERERTQTGGVVINPEVFEKAVQEVAQKTAENTELKSERTLLRQRTEVLEERIQRLTAELDRVRAEGSGATPAANNGKVLASDLVVLLEGADAFLWPLGQAIDFLDDLSHEMGNERAPSLDAHLRSLKLLQGLLERLRDGFHDS